MSSTCLGFLTVRQHAALGYFGGLLTLNELGRPLEFHCSLPIKPSRAQAILYGASLTDFLVGEQIGSALTSKVRKPPDVLLTDLPAMLSLRNVQSTPIVCLQPSHMGDGKGRMLTSPEGGGNSPLQRFALGDYQLSVLQSYRQDRDNFLSLWESTQPSLDLEEPFSRIVEALQEANPSAKAA